MQHLKLAFAFAALFCVLGAPAYARPNVSLHLMGSIVERDSSGKVTLEPVGADTAFKPGETVRYDVVASNAGSDPAVRLAPVARIPAGTAYEPGSASFSSGTAVEFSLDGGKTWSKFPTVKVATAKGVVEKKADPATFTAIRWMMGKPLAPKASVLYSYDVRVK